MKANDGTAGAGAGFGVAVFGVEAVVLTATVIGAAAVVPVETAFPDEAGVGVGAG